MKQLCLIFLFIGSFNVYATHWKFRTSSNLSTLDSKEWQNYPEGKNPIAREFEGYIEYKTLLSKEYIQSGTGIYLGKIGDADRTFLNGDQIGQTGIFPPAFTYNMDTERAYSFRKVSLWKM